MPDLNKLGDDPYYRRFIHDLWGEGFTIVARPLQKFDVPVVIPKGVSYQWNVATDRAVHEANGWHAIPMERHPGVFAPVGIKGDVIIDGLILMEKNIQDVEAARAAHVHAAVERADKFIDKITGEGFSGHIKTGYDEESADTKQVGSGLGSGDETKIPLELTPFILEILAEQTIQLKKLCPDGYPAPGVKAGALNIAINIIRDKHKDQLNADAIATD